MRLAFLRFFTSLVGTKHGTKCGTTLSIFYKQRPILATG